MAEENNVHLQEINEEIYKRNLELAVVNKTLSLLRKLYQISLLTLNPATLSEKISETVRVDLNMEAVGILLYEEKTDTLKPFKFSESDRFVFKAAKFGISLDTLTITGVSSRALLKSVMLDKKWTMTNNLADIWESVADAQKLKTLSDESHVQTILVYPLITQDTLIGTLILGLNRAYESLNTFEKDSIDSFIDVIAVALDKALLYEELKVLNQQLQALDKARSDFITIASHQLRTPPATIKWYLSALLSGDYGSLNDEVKVQLQKAEVTNNGLISLIDDMLNASRIERGKMEFMFEETDLVELTKLAYDQLIPMATMKKLQLEYHEPTMPIPIVMADKEKMRQVINNFIDNALKYTKAGSVVVGISADAENVTVQVTDTGKGLTKEEQESLFEKYTRGKDAMTHSAGLGLGLYVAKIIIGQHNGKIWAQSAGQDQGSTFAFSIPIHSTLPPNSVLNLADVDISHK